MLIKDAVNCEALAPGIAFDVVGKRKYRKRFYIESIEAQGAPVDSPCLFSLTDDTQLVLPTAVAPQSSANGTSKYLFQLF